MEYADIQEYASVLKDGLRKTVQEVNIKTNTHPNRCILLSTSLLETLVYTLLVCMHEVYHPLFQRYVSHLVSMECAMLTLDTATALLDILGPPVLIVRELANTLKLWLLILIMHSQILDNVRTTTEDVSRSVLTFLVATAVPADLGSLLLPQMEALAGVYITKYGSTWYIGI